MAKLASWHRQATFACRQAKIFLSESKTFLLADVQNVLAEHEMFEKFGGGETSKHGHAVETISCQANNVGQFRQAFIDPDLIENGVLLCMPMESWILGFLFFN